MRHEPALLQAVSDGTSLMDRAYRRLKREIIELERPPGDQFTEQHVATAWGLSKTPVREALARLHRDGLVHPVPRAGYIVSAVTLGDVADLCDMRTLLQGEAAALTAAKGLSVAERERLVELCVDDGYGQLGGPHLDERLRSNYEFETIIANGGGNDRLAESIAEVFDEIERIVRLAVRLSPGMPPFRIEERQAIVDAIVEQKPEAARAAMQHRTRSARREILDALSTSQAIISTPILVPLP
ncbi:GntR family transcriptional regulator (plasmid) [Rhodococcus opacus]|uniref:GntR family transcriptional regulator n=1 Tax=Rhodococcus opacus TaxID=37919 RepID=A0ABT4NT07_RHOOP|nr:GntR family transcriptional regulator [Rhodococcus opacus]MCZ4590524.1 GntR family transcriptional regulator [Rhodococcus opacus]MDV7087609.1 GntR family transcriptional regulator [Rhodococcus opacus]WKN61106.1 GntR family transcriptional regulator [Rhodococcus opacus]